MNSLVSSLTPRKGLLLVLYNVMNKSASAWSRCTFHLGVFQGIVSTGEREYTIYGIKLIQGHTRRCGEDRSEDFLYLESMPRRRDHVAVILRATGFDQLIQADSSSNNALSNNRTWRITRARTGLSSPAGYLYKPWDHRTTEWYSSA